MSWNWWWQVMPLCLPCCVQNVTSTHFLKQRNNIQYYFSKLYIHSSFRLVMLFSLSEYRERKMRWHRQDLIWQFVDEPQHGVWESIIWERMVLKIHRSHNQSRWLLHTSIWKWLLYGHWSCLHWFSIRAQHGIIIYWVGQIPPNVAYI